MGKPRVSTRRDTTHRETPAPTTMSSILGAHFDKWYYKFKDEEGKSRTRKIRWPYLVIVVGAPVTHIIVSSMRHFPRHRKLFIGAIVGTTVLTVINRVVLMHDSGLEAPDRKTIKYVEKELPKPDA